MLKGNMRTIKVAVCYRVLQSYRVPVFERLNEIEDIELTVFHGEDIEGSKTVNFKGATSFSTKILGGRVFSMTTRYGGVNIPINLGLYSELKKLSPDVIITEGASNIFNNLVAFIYSKLHRKKIIQWGLGEIRGRSRSFHRKAADVVFGVVERKSDAAISYSTFGAEYYLKKGLPADRVFVAVNVVDTEKKRSEYLSYLEKVRLGGRDGQASLFNILFVGALEENKRVDILIRAFSLLEKKYDHVRLHICGDGNYRHKYEEVAKSVASNNCMFHGHVSLRLAEFFSVANIFVLPGLGGLAISDALVHNVPVICTIGDGCEGDLISNNGKIIPEMTEERLAEEIESLINDPRKLAQWKENSYKIIDKKYNVKNYVSEIYKAIHCVL